MVNADNGRNPTTISSTSERVNIAKVSDIIDKPQYSRCKWSLEWITHACPHSLLHLIGQNIDYHNPFIIFSYSLTGRESYCGQLLRQPFQNFWTRKYRKGLRNNLQTPNSRCKWALQHPTHACTHSLLYLIGLIVDFHNPFLIINNSLSGRERHCGQVRRQP